MPMAVIMIIFLLNLFIHNNSNEATSLWLSLEKKKKKYTFNISAKFVFRTENIGHPLNRFRRGGRGSGGPATAATLRGARAPSGLFADVLAVQNGLDVISVQSLVLQKGLSKGLVLLGVSAQNGTSSLIRIL